MAQIPDHELYPSLLDRLVDRGRVVERGTFRWCLEKIEDCGLELTAVRRALAAAGLRQASGGSDPSTSTEVYESYSGTKSIRAALETPFPTPDGRNVSLSDLVELSDVTRRPVESDHVGNATLGARELRASVVQNLGWLLNTIQLMDDEELSNSPELRASVLNYGIPVIAGNTRSSVSVRDVADGIQAAIRRFEPRLSELTVSPVETADRSLATTIGFRIEARLWGPQSDESFSARTSLDLETGRFEVRRDLR